MQPEGGVSVSAVMHRPLRAAKPSSFGFRGVCQEAYEETQGNCVAHQLKAVLRQTLPLETAMSMCGGSGPEFHFDQIFEELYPLRSRKTTRTTCRPKASAAPGERWA